MVSDTTRNIEWAMSVRYTQVKKLGTVDEFREHCVDLGIEIPIDD